MTAVNPFADDVVHLRQWGTDDVFALLPPLETGCYIGSAGGCALRLPDGQVAARHAKLTRADKAWSMVSVAAATALRVDGQWCKELVLSPGIEVGIGGATLIAESPQWITLRAFCARLLGWSADRARSIDGAMRAVRLAASRRAPLVLCGDGDMVPIAYALHRHTLGASAPFIVCDKRRTATAASTRCPANKTNAIAAYDAATDGTLCVRARRLPSELPLLMKRLYEPSSRVQLVVCMDAETRGAAVLATMPPPLDIPPLALREVELPRIIDEYAADAMATVGAPTSSFTGEHREWVIGRAARTLDEVEKATLRLVALSVSESLTQAAGRLGMASVSLSRWLQRRGGFAS